MQLGEPDWRVPIRAYAEEVAKGFTTRQELELGEGPRVMALRWLFYGPYAEANVGRVLRAEACLNCLATFPERPTKQSCARILAECGPFPVARPQARRRVREGRCPHCGTEVSPEFASMVYQETTMAEDVRR